MFFNRLKEHKKDNRVSSAVMEHALDKNHEISWDSSKILAEEPQLFKRKVLESLYIRQLQPQRNRDSDTDALTSTLIETTHRVTWLGTSSLSNVAKEGGCDIPENYDLGEKFVVSWQRIIYYYA